MNWTRGKNTLLLAAQEHDNWDNALSLAASILKRGGLVAFPTETVYGLGADALNETAVRKIYEVKGRPPDNPLIVHVAAAEMIEQLALTIPEEVYILGEKFWPGPLTVVLPKKARVPDITTGGISSVAVRFPAHPLAQRLLSITGIPLAAPSANISGRPSPTTAEHVMHDLAGRIEAVLDGGDCAVGVESTVLSLLSEPPTILRPGGITLEMLQEALGKEILDLTVDSAGETFKSVPLSPGMKYRHYATNAPLYLVEGEEEARWRQMTVLAEHFSKLGSRVGLLIFKESVNSLEAPFVEILGSRREHSEVARRLFDALRKLDAMEVDVIIAEGLEDIDMGKAVMNRLRKASTYILKAE